MQLLLLSTAVASKLVKIIMERLVKTNANLRYMIYYVKSDKSGTVWYKDCACKILHRENGPAVEYATGEQRWYLNGKLHREGGPAAVHANGDKSWYLDGHELTEAEFNARTASCAGKVVEIDGKKYKLVAI
jgi:hypothetical protein